MKCAICENKTTWDESYGRETFIVCPKCYEKLRKKYGLKTLSIILTIGYIKEEKNKK